MKSRIERALSSLNGLSAGDAFGQQFFGDPDVASRCLTERTLPRGIWNWTDDTAMALGIFRTLRRCGRIEQDVLADYFAAEYASAPNRGYGGMAHNVLRAIGSGTHWKTAAAEVFSGLGSFGNGGAMRVAPVGAFFSDNLEQAAEYGGLSAAVTHAHPEGIAGGIAVAVAAAWAASADGASSSSEMLTSVVARLPDSDVKSGVSRALQMGFDRDPQLVAAKLGSGLKVSAPDTVPFALWCAAKCFCDFREAMWTTAIGLGDVDTTCAMVGGIVALSSGEIPSDFLANREPLPLDISEN